jgi:hypothetical protein
MGFEYRPGVTKYSTNTNNYKSSSTSNNKKDDSDTNKGNRTASIKKDGILAGIGFRGRDVDESVDKKADKYNIPGEHKLSSEFRRLSDKYYGGDQKEFAKTSQGQVLLRALEGTPFTRGGGLGLMNKELQEKVANLDSGFPFDSDSDEFMSLEASADPFKTKNIPVNYIRKNLSGPEYAKFNQYLYSMRPDLYSQARPFSSGRIIPDLLKSGIFNPAGMVARGVLNAGMNLAGKEPLQKSEPFQGIIGPEGTFQYALRNEFDPETGELFLPGYTPRYTKASQADQIIQPISAELFENLEPLDTDQGGMNDVAQAVVNQNQMPPEIDMALIQEYLDSLPEGGINTFDPDSFAFSIG